MKKILKIFFLIIICGFPLKVLATGGIKLSTNTLEIEVGKTATLKITADNSAGKISISSNNNDIASSSITTEFLDLNSVSVTITARKIGNTSIVVTADDVTTYDDEKIKGKQYIVNIKVVEAKQQEEKPKETTTTIPITTQTIRDNNTSQEKTTTKNTENLSKNYELLSLEVEGYKINKIDDKNYELTVGNSVEKINILATAKDNKAKISGKGIKNLKDGENKFEIIITSESGQKNKIILVVKKQEYFSINDIENVIADQNNKNKEIIIEKDFILNQNTLDLIKDNKVIIKFTYLDEEGKKKYSWIIDGNKLNINTPINTGITFEKQEKISQKMNYAEGIYINLNHTGIIPDGINIEIPVNNNYKNGDKVNLYYLNNNEVEINQKNIEVKDQNINLQIKKGTNYFISMAQKNNANTSNNKTKVNGLLPILFIIDGILMIIIIIILIIKCIQKNKKTL